MNFFHLLWTSFVILQTNLNVCLGIVGGQPASHFPYLARLIFYQFDFPFRDSLQIMDYCGGTFIGPDMVLTAARCLYSNTKRVYFMPNQIDVQLMLPYGHFGGIRGEMFKVHPKFDPSSHSSAFDIAVLKTTHDFSGHFAQLSEWIPPCADSFQFSPGYAVGIGWRNILGSHEDSGMLEGMTQDAWPHEVSLKRNVNCTMPTWFDRNRDIRVWTFSKNQLCYDSEHPETGIYRHDEGGPLVYKPSSTSRARCLIGVASFYRSSTDGRLLTSVFTPVTLFAEFVSASIKSLGKISCGSKCEIL